MTTTMISMKIVQPVSCRSRADEVEIKWQINSLGKICLLFQYQKIHQFNAMRPMHVNGLECVFCRAHFVDWKRNCRGFRRTRNFQNWIPCDWPPFIFNNCDHVWREMMRSISMGSQVTTQCRWSVQINRVWWACLFVLIVCRSTCFHTLIWRVSKLNFVQPKARTKILRGWNKRWTFTFALVRIDIQFVLQLWFTSFG